jgi:hypothetical protein
MTPPPSAKPLALTGGRRGTTPYYWVWAAPQSRRERAAGRSKGGSPLQLLRYRRETARRAEQRPPVDVTYASHVPSLSLLRAWRLTGECCSRKRWPSRGGSPCDSFLLCICDQIWACLCALRTGSPALAGLCSGRSEKGRGVPFDGQPRGGRAAVNCAGGRRRSRRGAETETMRGCQKGPVPESEWLFPSGRATVGPRRHAAGRGEECQAQGRPPLFQSSARAARPCGRRGS